MIDCKRLWIFLVQVGLSFGFISSRFVNWFYSHQMEIAAMSGFLGSYDDNINKTQGLLPTTDPAPYATISST